MKTRALLFLSVLALLTALPSVAQSGDTQSGDQKPANSTASQPASATPQTRLRRRPGGPTLLRPRRRLPLRRMRSSREHSAFRNPGRSGPEVRQRAPAKHDGSKKDVDAIGNRKVGGLDWYSIEKRDSHGKQYAMQVEQTVN